jgi:hypothetical protein
MLRDVLLALLMTLPPSKYTDELPAAREARMGAIAGAIASASKELTCRDAFAIRECRRKWPGSAQEVALVLTTIAWHESGFDQGVHAGECKSFQCDPIRKRDGVVLKFRATSLWQIHSNALVPEPVWRTLAGADEESTRRAALIAGRLASGARRMCEYQHRGGDWVTMTFAAYGTGSVCHKESAKTRAATFHRFSRKLEAIRLELRARGAA